MAMNRTKGSILGVGINDSPSPVQKFKQGRLEWICPYYKMWKSMITRSYSSRLHFMCPTYKDVEVAAEFKMFSNFKQWVVEYEFMHYLNKDDNLALDKDLKSGHIYSPETCLIIPHELNSFFLQERKPLKTLPVGVDIHKGRFRARCALAGTTSKDLGYFETEALAREAYLNAKRSRGYVLCEKYKDYYGIDIFKRHVDNLGY